MKTVEVLTSALQVLTSGVSVSTAILNLIMTRSQRSKDDARRQSDERFGTHPPALPGGTGMQSDLRAADGIGVVDDA